MKNVTTIDLGDGIAREVDFISSPDMAPDRLIISLPDDRLPSQILADFEGRSAIKAMNTMKPGRTEIYEGFAEAVEFKRERDGSARITLARR